MFTEQMNLIKDFFSDLPEMYFVGGCVRDLLMGKEPKDYDLASPHSADDMEAFLKSKGRRCYLIGKKFGTVGVKINGQLIEVTTFRSEVYDLSSRKPQVKFSENLRSDLKRRDFTINAIAVDMNGKIYDPYNGQKDIMRGIIRAVDNPKDRFMDDPLRILRAIRFAGRFNFKIDGRTKNAIEKTRNQLPRLSIERVIIEMDQILALQTASNWISFMFDNAIFNYIIPELGLLSETSQWYDEEGYDDALNDTYKRLTRTQIHYKESPDLIDRMWGVLLYDIIKPITYERNQKTTHLLRNRMMENISRNLKFSNERRKYLVSFVLSDSTKH